MVPRMFERTSSQLAWSKKEATDNSESGIAVSTEGGDDEMVQENIEMVQEDITLVMKSEFFGIDSSLMLTSRSKLVVVSNSTITMGISESPKSQPIIKESNPFNTPLILVVEVKSDTLVAKLSDIEATLPTHDSSPIIAPIKSNSQQSQW